MPTFVAATEFDSNQGSSAFEAAAPSGVQAGDYQLTVAYIVSSSSNFPDMTGSGWSIILNEAVTYGDGASSGRLVLLESTTATGILTATLTGSRVFQSARCAWRGAARSGAPLFAFRAVSAAPSFPAIDAPANSLVIGIGGSEVPDADGNAGWGFTGTDIAIERARINALNGVEPSSIAVGEIQCASAATGVTAAFPLSSSQEGAMASILLVGV